MQHEDCTDLHNRGLNRTFFYESNSFTVYVIERCWFKSSVFKFKKWSILSFEVEIYYFRTKDKGNYSGKYKSFSGFRTRSLKRKYFTVYVIEGWW